MIKASLKRSQMKTKAATARKNPFHHSIHLIIQDAKYFLRPGIEPSEIGVKGARYTIGLPFGYLNYYRASVTRKKSPNVYKSCLKMISVEK